MIINNGENRWYLLAFWVGSRYNGKIIDLKENPFYAV